MCCTRLNVLAAVSLLLVCPSVFAQSGPPKHPPSPKLLGPAKWDPTAQEISAAYWTLEPGWDTEVEMRNNLRSHELTITPVLRRATGEEIPLSAVTIAPQHIISVDLRSAGQVDPAVLDRAGSFGSVVFRFNGLDSANLFAAAMVHRHGLPIDFHFDADDSGPDYSSGGIEGIWWIPAQSSTDYLILSNPSRKTVSGFLALSELSRSNRPTRVSIGPGQTIRIDIKQFLGPSSVGSMGGLSLSLPGKESLSATQIVFDEVTGLTAIMKLFDRETDDRPRDHALIAPMMALSQPDAGLGFPNGTTLIPRVFLRNAGSAPAQVSMDVDWRTTDTSGTLALPRLSLAPGDVRVINLVGRVGAGSIPPDANWGTLKIDYTGKRADLIAIALSYDKSGRYGLQTPFSEALGRLWAGGMWHVDATHNTLVTTGNGGLEPTTAEVTIFYNGGKGHYTMKKLLQPGQPFWLDLGQLIHNQIPDAEGHTIPPEVTSGSYELRDVDHATVGQLYEGKLVIDKTYGHAVYGCGTCCGYSVPTFVPDPYGGPVGDSYTEVLQSTEQCGGDLVDVAANAFNWGSSNTAVATLSKMVLHAVAKGLATGSAQVTLQGTHPAPQCPSPTYAPTQPVTVNPPTANISMNFTGSKSTGDNLSFKSASYECSESLGLQSCSTAWVWNVEGKGLVSDDASNWTVNQSYTGRAKGYYKDSQGVLHAFDDTLNVPNDGPDSSFLQQPSGQQTIYWIDGPGYNHKYNNGYPVDSITQVQNFSTKFCSTTVAGDCNTFNWYFKLIVKPGAVLDTSNSIAANGSASTNF